MINNEINSSNRLISKIFGLYEGREREFLIVLWGFIFSFIILYAIFFTAPSNFPEDKIVRIEDGLSLNQIAIHLKDESVIKNETLFKFFAFITFNQKGLASGDYFFGRKTGLFNVLFRLASANYEIDPINITIPEGSTVIEISDILKENLLDFNDELFLQLAINKEGFLFPETYKFLPNQRPIEIITKMERTFNEKIEPLKEEINESGRTLDEIIIMASLIEEEARTYETRKVISGILWKRIDIGMPLQVDAVFPYIIGKNTFELTLEDLDFESPYNTYRNKGLPPGAISNPGLGSIEAALRPQKSNYLFYLSDLSGNMHYAEDFEMHKRNKAIYLR